MDTDEKFQMRSEKSILADGVKNFITMAMGYLIDKKVMNSPGNYLLFP